MRDGREEMIKPTREQELEKAIEECKGKFPRQLLRLEGELKGFKQGQLTIMNKVEENLRKWNKHNNSAYSLCSLCEDCIELFMEQIQGERK